MGGIHPRLKRPVGRRLAVAAVALLHPSGDGPPTPLTGPTIAGCRYEAAAGGGGGGKLQLMFNQTLLGDDDVLVQEFGTNTSVRLHDDCWHLGCILPRVPAIIVRSGVGGRRLAHGDGLRQLPPTRPRLANLRGEVPSRGALRIGAGELRPAAELRARLCGCGVRPNA